MVHQKEVGTGSGTLTSGQAGKCRIRIGPVGQVVKTAASHAVNVGSNPARVTKVFSGVCAGKLEVKSLLQFNSLK